MRRTTRRECLRSAAAAALGLVSSRLLRGVTVEQKTWFTIALGEYSFNTAYRAGQYDPLQLASLTRNKFGLSAIDYVSSFWADKAKDQNFLRELKKRASDNGIVNHIILVDLSGPQLGDLDASRRNAAIHAHRPWLDVASFLGCSGIRVNLSGVGLNGFGSPGNKQAVLRSSVDGYGRLLEFARPHNLDVLVQNHMGYSCDPDWLVGVMRQVNNKHAGIEADPGHFQEVFAGVETDPKHLQQIFSANKPRHQPAIKTGQSFDLYAGWAKIMPYAKAVNAKTHAFDARGDETTIDYRRILQITKKAGYTGYVGIEWEPEGKGRQMSPTEGIEATKALLRRHGGAAAS